MNWRRLALCALLASACGDQPPGTDPSAPPAPPSGLATYSVAGGAVAVAWAPAPGALGHELERSRATTGETVTWRLAADARTLLDSGTVAREVYTYRVRAWNAAGLGAPVVRGVLTAAPGVEVAVQPGALALGPNGKQAFSATVNGSVNQLVAWVVLEGAYGGAVSSTGTYRAPLRTGRFHLLAISADSVAGLAVIDVT